MFGKALVHRQPTNTITANRIKSVVFEYHRPIVPYMAEKESFIESMPVDNGTRYNI